MINFDEMYEKNKCGLDTKLKMLIGPAKSVQVLQVRSLVGHLKYPVLFRNNYPMSKKCINETIHTLESVNLKILFSCCDQGGSNEGLQKSLKVTIENNTFENPFDTSRRVIFGYDYWHALKIFTKLSLLFRRCPKIIVTRIISKMLSNVLIHIPHFLLKL